jgi:hypothetical protein
MTHLEQEPVAFLVYDPKVQSQELYFDDELGDTDCCDITPLYTTPPQPSRNDTLEEVAQEFDKMKVFGDTAASFAIFVREMKS